MRSRVLTFLSRKKSSDVRHKELLEGVAISLLQLAGEKAGEWALSKPHSPLLLQIAASISGGGSMFVRRRGTTSSFLSSMIVRVPLTTL